MGQQLDTSGSYKHIQNTETITFLVKTGQGQFADPVQVQYAKRRAATIEDLDNDDALRTKRLVWHLWKAPLLAAGVTGPPMKGDVIQVSASEGWVLHTVEVQSVGQRYRCLCERRAGE